MIKAKKNEMRGVIVLLSIFVAIVVFGDTAIEFIGEAKCYAVAGWIGNFLAPFFIAGVIFLILYFFGYFFFIVPRKILRQCKKLMK